MKPFDLALEIKKETDKYFREVHPQLFGLYDIRFRDGFDAHLMLRWTKAVQYAKGFRSYHRNQVLRAAYGLSPEERREVGLV